MKANQALPRRRSAHWNQNNERERERERETRRDETRVTGERGKKKKIVKRENIYIYIVKRESKKKILF